MMDGTKLLEEIQRRLTQENGNLPINDAALARKLGVTQATIGSYRGRKITPRQAVNLMENYAKAAERRLIDESVVPIVEFFGLRTVETSRGKTLQVFSTKDNDDVAYPYLSGLRERLEKAHGIYIFYDSRGHAIYVGKALKMTLWHEINKVYNRTRERVQNIMRVQHPGSRRKYKGWEKIRRQIVKEPVALYHLANYMSAYQVSTGLINKIEALIVRSFANDLLNIRMEKF